jgi:hypothetical protein
MSECVNFELFPSPEINVSSMHRILTSPPAPLLTGEGSKKPNFSLLLPLLAGEGGWVGEVCRIHVEIKRSPVF